MRCCLVVGGNRFVLCAKKAYGHLIEVGLEAQAFHRADTLSGGQQ